MQVLTLPMAEISKVNGLHFVSSAAITSISRSEFVNSCLANPAAKVGVLICRAPYNIVLSLIIAALIVTEGDLKKFLKTSPKYTGAFAGAAIGAMIAPVAAIPLVGGIVATYLVASKKGKEYDDPPFSKEYVKKYLPEEIERRTNSINQKMKTIEQLQQEIAMDQQKIAECTFIIDKLESETE
jgi:hypothetical protein